MNNERRIQVVAGWLKTEPVIGVLFASTQRGNQTYSFEYSDYWLKNFGHLTLDPDLYPFRGRQFLPAGKKMFGMFSDCSPDRWGRKLMNRRESIVSQQEGRSQRTLYEIDYLLGVFDDTRSGALRFKDEKTGKYYSSETYLETPPLAKLRQLQQYSFDFEDNKDPYEKKWIKQLIVPGSSLGGARPKSSVKDEYGAFWIAKFSSRNDEFHVPAWEKTLNELAAMVGLDVPESMYIEFDSLSSCFLSKRFDRNMKDGNYGRIHFTSAMTMLGKIDGDSASYLDIAEFIKQNSSKPQKDLYELWSRIAFNMAVSNTDDHLRNHGFLLKNNFWELSPLFDITPSLFRSELSLNIDEYNSAKDTSLLLETAKYYAMDFDTATERLTEIFSIVQKNWRRIASKYGISNNEQALMKKCFPES